MKMKFKTHKAIDDHYRNLGVDVDALQREFEETGILFEQAEKNVRKRKGFFARLFWRPHGGFFSRLGYIDPELDAEYDRLDKIQESTKIKGGYQFATKKTANDTDGRLKWQRNGIWVKE